MGGGYKLIREECCARSAGRICIYPRYYIKVLCRRRPLTLEIYSVDVVISQSKNRPFHRQMDSSRANITGHVLIVTHVMYVFSGLHPTPAG
jgi:hypothetical protein